MRYRLNTGVESDLKQQAASVALILAVTIGLPVFGAWINYERFLPRSPQVSQEADDGAVLGEKTEAPTNSDDSSADTNTVIDNGTVPAAVPIRVTPTRRSSPLRVTPSLPPAPAAVPAPAPPTDTSTDEPAPIVTDTPPTKENEILPDVLPIVDGLLEVDTSIETGL